MQEPRLLFLMNPGRQSRHYVRGLVAAARRLGMRHAVLDLAQTWARLSTAADRSEETLSMQRAIASLVERAQITHAVGYAWNGLFDLGLRTRPHGPGRGLFPTLGIKHLMLWSDHPEWFGSGEALSPHLSPALGDPLHFHFVKSAAAAAELAQVSGWPNVRALAMAEDPDAVGLRSRAEPIHDIVAIVGAVHGLPAPATAMLDHDSPTPADIDCACAAHTLVRFDSWARARFGRSGPLPALRELAREWVAAKIHAPCSSFWRLSGSLGPAHADALALLKDDPQHWYGAVALLRKVGDWRREFMLAWLARRVDVGVYGADASPLEVPQPDGAADWIEYADQARCYSRGRCAINTNASHDEEGCTHKPFQIAASGVACIHHHTRGLDGLFEPGSEVGLFERPVDLLDQIRALRDDRGRRDRMAQAAHARLLRDHSWESRLLQMIAAAEQQAQPVLQRPPPESRLSAEPAAC